MNLTRHRMLLAAAVAAVVTAAGAGAALATGALGGSQTPQERQAAILQDLAGRLGVDVDKLKAALKGVAGDQIDQALADGTITKAQADALKQRLQSGDVPLGLGLHGPGPGHGHGPGFGHDGPGPGLDAAAGYLGLTDAQLRTQLQSGKTLAQVAKDRGKSVEGLEQAMLEDASARLDDAVAAGRLTAAEKTAMLERLKSRIAAIVDGQLPPRPDRLRGLRGNRFA